MNLYSKILTSCSVFLLLFNIHICSQPIIEIKGKVIDESGNALPYATIALINNKKATLSNENGYFNLKLPNSNYNDKIAFKYLGFKNKTVSVSNLKDSLNIIQLSVLTHKLKTINIKYQKPEDVILEALSRVPENYFSKATNLKGFYRERVTENNENIQFIEAVVGVYKAAYDNAKDKDRIKIIKAREQQDVKKSTFFNYLYFVDGPYEALQLDVAKYPKNFIKVINSNISFLNQKHFKHYKFKFIEPMDNPLAEEHYLIQFKPKKRKAVLEGVILINREDYAIISLDFKVSEINKSYSSLINSNNEQYLNYEGYHTKTRNFHCKTEFKFYDGEYVLSNSKLEYSFYFINNSGNDSTIIANSINFVVTDIETNNVIKYKNRETIWRNGSLSRQIGEYDPEFWENYNVIELEH